MSGFVQAIGACFGCSQPFSFNPHRVPSIRIDGDRKPICRACMDAANQRRKALGLEPHPILPDAYDAIPEGEL